jgi:meso-butanediol dehydrogenase/(S,S)-butanediol dehydrogenase/diacetyl reductase
MRLKGKRVLITGTGSGLGSAAQASFCREGAIVHGCDLRPGAAEASSRALAELGHDAVGSTVDLADPDAARAWADSAVEAMGGLDVLYNNAGAPLFAPFAEMTVNEWHHTISNELDIVFYVTSAAWPHLRKAGGSVINTASVVGSTGVGRMGQAAHCAAKGGVLALTRQLAAEGAADGIRANAISPGFIETPGTADVPDEMRRWVVESLHLLPRAGNPEDVALLAVYLASDESSFVTGADFPVDGGWLGGSS